MEIKRENLIATLGGEEAVARMDSEAKADALEDFLSSELDKILLSTDPFPTAAEVEQKIPTRHYRMGVGNLFVAQAPGAKVKTLPPMPDKPTLDDFSRFASHGQSRPAERRASDEERHVRGDHPRVPAARYRPGTDEGRSRLLGRPDVRALRAREDCVCD